MARLLIMTGHSGPPASLRVCQYISFWDRLRGLMFTSSIPEQGILMVENSNSRINSSIHMFFMNYDIGVVWINSEQIVVDKTLARKWMPFYAPRDAAQMILETHPELLSAFTIGDRIDLNHAQN